MKMAGSDAEKGGMAAHLRASAGSAGAWANLGNSAAGLYRTGGNPDDQALVGGSISATVNGKP